MPCCRTRCGATLPSRLQPLSQTSQFFFQINRSISSFVFFKKTLSVTGRAIINTAVPLCKALTEDTRYECRVCYQRPAMLGVTWRNSIVSVLFLLLPSLYITQSQSFLSLSTLFIGITLRSWLGSQTHPSTNRTLDPNPRAGNGKAIRSGRCPYS